MPKAKPSITPVTSGQHMSLFTHTAEYYVLSKILDDRETSKGDKVCVAGTLEANPPQLKAFEAAPICK
jgi:hypothetical protein